MNKVCIIALKYNEPEYQDTLACIEKAGVPVTWAERDGVGNYSRAFNEAFFNRKAARYKYVWMISNITFTPMTLSRLVKSMERTGYAALHPAMPGSDHRHQWPDGSDEIRPAKFIEWTAPIVRSDVFLRNPLDTMLAYYYMDLAWSFEVQRLGYKVGVDHGAQVEHLYLRNRPDDHPVSVIRKQLRSYWTPISRTHMENIYGPEWEHKMNWK